MEWLKVKNLGGKQHFSSVSEGDLSNSVDGTHAGYGVVVLIITIIYNIVVIHAINENYRRPSSLWSFVIFIVIGIVIASFSYSLVISPQTGIQASYMEAGLKSVQQR